MEKPIYLDYNATTPVDPRVRAAMLPYLGDEFGNPSSTHAFGRSAWTAVERARLQVADLLGCAPDEVVFTGGGSESDNLAIQGVAFANRPRGRHIVTSTIEHPAVLNTCRYLAEQHGFDVTYVGADQYGRVDPEAVLRAIRPDTLLISIMHANNETGTIQPIEEIGGIACAAGIPFHSDASQSIGKIPTPVGDLGVDLLTIAGHKIYAPKGIGALYVRRSVNLQPIILGGGQERGLRAGTENVPYMVALGHSCEIAAKLLPAEGARMRSLRDRLHGILVDELHEVQLNGHPDERLPNTLNVGFPGVIGSDLLDAVPEIAFSTGSACHPGSSTPSPVLAQMGLSTDVALGAVRLSLGRYTTEAEVDEAARHLIRGVRDLRRRFGNLKG